MIAGHLQIKNDNYYILSPQEAADMDDLEDTQYRLEKELEELRPIRAFVRMGDGTAAEAPAVMDEATPTDLAPLREPPAAPQVATHNFRFSEDYDLYPSGAKTKYKNNVMAIKLLKQIELEKRTATPEEQIILARYVGWGGLANAFSSTASGWENEYQELKSLLTDVEYKAAMNSTITAYYTEPDLIRHIYRALERFGFEGGPDRKILDPGMGTGNFYSVLPEQFQGSKLFGVELDSITGRIAKQQQIQEAFASWVWKEPERRDRLLRIYNETFNTVRPREFDGSHLVFPGMNTEMKLRKHQLDFAARVIYTGTGLAAHEVGAGKTAALIAAGMYLKNLGAIHKAVFVVPNPLVGQWATEFYRFFPNANLLVSTAEDFTPKNRNRYISKIATGEYDAVILAHSQFEKIPISTERQIAMLERQINDIENAIHEIKSENGENWSVKQMVIFRKNLDERLKKLSAEEKKDDLLTFEQLGVDMMMVDEAHFFKNCFVFTKLRNVAGITTSSSQRAFDMLLKCQYLQETNQGRGVVFATGTPISNSISELFVMQRYLQPQELERFGWSYFDTWIAHFAKKASVLELKPEGGGYRMEAPDRWADLGFANLLGRYEEAKAHNAPIAAERQRQADERRAQQDAREQQLAQERQARYDSAIREAEGNIMAGKEVINREINGKSLIMQLFREHEIPVPLKTQGWIINSLHSIRYDPQIGEWNYRYFKGSRNSTKMFDLLSKLSAAIQTRQQFEEHGMSPPDSPVLDCEEEQDMEL